MPAPPQSAIYKAIKDALPSAFRPITAEQDEWIDALAAEIHGGWADWQNGIEGGGLEVCGSGLGTWTGTGEGGNLAQNSPILWSNPKPGWTTEISELNQFLLVHTRKEFSEWTAAYSFDGASYEGTSTATQNSSGTFDAEAIGTEAIGDVGSGEFPSAIRPDVVADLKGAGWFPDEPVAEIKGWLNAYDNMLLGQFQSWLDNTLWIDNTVQGPSAAGDGSGCGTSNNDGALD